MGLTPTFPSACSFSFYKLVTNIPIHPTPTLSVDAGKASAQEAENWGNQAKVLEILATQSPDPNQKSMEGYSPLVNAAYHCWIEVVKALLKAKVYTSVSGHLSLSPFVFLSLCFL